MAETPKPPVGSIREDRMNRGVGLEPVSGEPHPAKGGKDEFVSDASKPDGQGQGSSATDPPARSGGAKSGPGAPSGTSQSGGPAEHGEAKAGEAEKE